MNCKGIQVHVDVKYDRMFFYLNGALRGSMTRPSLVMTLGLVIFWKLSVVFHSLPNGARNDRSYCSLFWKGKGIEVTWYLAAYKYRVLLGSQFVQFKKLLINKPYLLDPLFADNDITKFGILSFAGSNTVTRQCLLHNHILSVFQSLATPCSPSW